MGGIDWDSVETTAEGLYRSAGEDAAAGVAPLRLAKGLGLRVAVAHGAGLPGLAALCRVHGEYRIYLRARLDQQRENWAIAHELGEWVLALAGYADPDREALANAIGAAVIAPRPFFLRAVREAGSGTWALAKALGASESLTSLRLGEVTGEPLVLVAPASIRVRGRAWSWPQTEPAIRRLVKTPGPGITAAKLRDAPQRALLIANG